jgi:hypothetical protein
MPLGAVCIPKTRDVRVTGVTSNRQTQSAQQNGQGQRHGEVPQSLKISRTEISPSDCYSRLK